MILGDPKKWDELAEAGVYGTLTLDEMLQRAAAEESGTQAALGDFVNEALTWAQLEARVARIADFLLDQGLKRDDTVVSLCGGGVNAIVTLLALSRAGMVALPLSPLTGARDLAEICEQFGARAIITETRVGPRQTAQTAAMAAFSAFHIRFLMAWGADLPDGVISLDEVLDLPPDENQTPATAMRGGRASDHVFVMTGDGDGDSRAFPARNHGQLVATAMPLTLKARLTANSVIATPMVASSLCGLSIVAAWLMTRSHLHYLPAWQVDGFAEAAKMARGDAPGHSRQAGGKDQRRRTGHDPDTHVARPRRQRHPRPGGNRCRLAR